MIPIKAHVKHLFRTIFEYLDVISGIMGVIVGLSILYLSIIGTINQHYIGFAVALASLIYLVLRSRLKEHPLQNFQLSPRQKNTINIIFFILIIITSFVWYNQLYSRPLLYFVLVSLLSGLISIEIMFFNKEDSVWPVLFKIFYLTFIVRMGIYYNFPTIMGYDAYFHVNIAEIISQTGFVPPFEISYQYVNYPILHIFISITKILSFIDIKDALFFSIGLINIISMLFIFIFIKHIAGPRIGFLSVLLICFTSQIIGIGITNITAGSLVICYFLMLLYLLLHGRWQISSLILCQFIMFIMIFTHQLSIFVVFLTLCLFALSILLFDTIFTTKKQLLKFELLALFGLSMILYWMYTPLYNNESFLQVVLGPFFDVLMKGGEHGSDVLIVGYQYVRPFFETVMLQTSYLILPFFAIGGIFFWLSHKDGIKFAFAFTAASLFFIVYAVPFLGIGNLLTDRWIPFLYIFLGILAAVYIISGIDLIKSNRVKSMTIFSIIVIFSFLMVVTPAINKDNPLVAKNTTIRTQFKDNEIDAVKTIKSFHDGLIIVDSDFFSPFFLYGTDNKPENQFKALNYVVSFSSEDELLKISENNGLLTLLRKSTLIEPVSLTDSASSGEIYAHPLPESSFAYFDGSVYQDLIFTNGNVIGYYSYG